jgi:hypothetical protein
MKNETVLRGSLVLTLLGSLWMMVMWNNDIIVVNNQRKTIDSLSYQNDSLKNEIQVQQFTIDHFDWLWTQLSELHPKDAEKIEHETE